MQQTYQDWELIAIDDGSTDNTFHELEAFTDPRIRLFQQENCGAAPTINRGISLARGDYFAILNSDDIYHPQRLEKLYGYLETNATVTLVASLIQPIDSSGADVSPGGGHDYWLKWYKEALDDYRTTQAPLLSLLKSNYIVSTSNIFIRASYFVEHRGFSDLLAYCHDYEFFLRAIRDDSFHLIEEPLLNYRLHKTNAIRENEFLRRLEVIYALFTTTDFEELLFDLKVEHRKEKPLFKALIGNSEINAEVSTAIFEEILRKKDDQLRQADSGLEIMKPSCRMYKKA